MTKRKTTKDHVKVANMEDGRYELICEHCKINAIITPPISMDEFLRIIEWYGKQHENCQPREGTL